MRNVFVSSTFRDMQAERDAIHYEIVPALNEFARKYGESVQLMDLRWGVNTAHMDADESALMVLNVCMDAIDRCQPYMIVLLGERYGWVPEVEQMLSVAREKNFPLEDPRQSVTALEIEYGSLSRQQQARCFFYFREALPAGEMTPESRAQLAEVIYKDKQYQAALNWAEAAIMLSRHIPLDKLPAANPHMDNMARMRYNRMLTMEFEADYKAAVTSAALTIARTFEDCQNPDKAAQFYAVALNGAAQVYEMQRTPEARARHEEIQKKCSQ